MQEYNHEGGYSIKLAYILGTFPSLSETFILDEIIGLKRKGVDVMIFALKRGNDKKYHERAKTLVEKTIYRPSFTFVEQWKMLFLFFLQHPIMFFQLLLVMFKSYKKTPLTLLKLYRNLPCALYFSELIKYASAQHVHAHFAYIPATITMIISRILDIPFSFSAHAWDIHANRSNLKEELLSARFVITCSEQNRFTLLKRYGEELSCKILKIYHGINLEYWNNRPEMSRLKGEKRRMSVHRIWRLMSVGRLIEKKGFDFLIKACALLKGNRVKFHLDLIGEGKERRALEKLAKSLGIEDEIAFIGALTHEELKQYYFSADIFVLPSVVAADGDQDGIPNVLLEAMAMGVPVISTRVSAIPELIKDGETGILARERDDKSFCEAIIKVINSGELRSNIIDNARLKVKEEFNLQDSVDKLYSLFKGGYC